MKKEYYHFKCALCYALNRMQYRLCQGVSGKY